MVEKSAALFAERGFAATSIGDIAAACECSKSRLYHYFENKEAILSFMLIEHVENLIEGSQSITEQHPDPIARFRSLIEFFMEIYAESGNKHIVMLTGIHFLSTPEKDLVLRKQHELINIVKQILREIRPDITDKDLAHVDTMLFFGMINWTYTWYDANGRVTPTELAHRSVELFLNGFRASRA